MQNQQQTPFCNTQHPNTEGIWQCLPGTIKNADVKEKEKAGWQALAPVSLEDVRSRYLEFPYVSESSDREFYNHAANQFDFVKNLLTPLTNKTGLDLGGSFGWAAYRFTQGGATMALADYNDSTPSGLGGAQVYLDCGIQFERYQVDAEALPFADNQFDFVFSSSFLHHLPSPQLCLHHISRILKPGGNYYAIMEAFCPKGTSRAKALKNADHIDDYLDQGINEQVFYQSEYRNWFTSAGLNFSIYNPRWDSINTDRTVSLNSKQTAESYQPELLTNRMNNPFPLGPLAKLLLRSHLWKIPAHPAIFSMLRGPLLDHTQKLRILHGLKPK